MLIERGGKNEERLYLFDDYFDLGEDHVIVKKTDLPDMENLVSRHKARYMLPAIFCRSGMTILDFPCGSGYGEKCFLEISPHIKYHGGDHDLVTIEYCERNCTGYFFVDDLTSPHLHSNFYDLIACIEGIEHIERKYQSPLIGSFLNALKPGGILVISTPEKSESPRTPYHLSELSGYEFKSLLTIPLVGFESIQTLNHKEQGTNWLYGICRKGD